MPTASIKAFDGLKPIVDPVLLEQGAATSAINTKLVSGAIQSLKGTTTLRALTKTSPATIFRYGSSSNENEYWLEFTSRTDVMRSPITDNQYGMLYWADGTAVKYAPNSLIVSGSSYPGASYTLGLPAPGSAAVITGTTPGAAATSVTLTAVYTYVSAYDEEGPPSAASAVVTVDPTGNITVANMAVAPTGAYNVTKKRIYISSTTGNAVAFQFWAEVPVATTSKTAAYDQTALGEVIPSTDWVAPPVNLKGLRMMANGIAVGFVENTAYASEPNLPHAWPHQYPADFKIVGVGTFGQSAAFLTESYPYVLSGVDPAAMSFEKLSLPQSCVSIDSIVETGNSVIYASPDGLVVIGSGGIDLATKSLMTKEQWQAYNPSTIKASLYESRYIATYTRTNGTRGMMIFDFSGQGATFVESDLNSASAITAMYHDARTDTLYLAQGTNILRWDAGSNLPYIWKSKVFRTGFPLNFSVGQVVSDTYPVVMKIYADGVLRQAKTVTDSNIFRLVSGFRAFDWQFELNGTGKLTQALISTSSDEVRNT